MIPLARHLIISSTRRGNRPTAPRQARGAFTLVELLAVIGVISLLVMGAAPVVTSLAYGGAFNQMLIRVSGTLEQARAHAVSNNTYTYVAFATDANKQLYLIAAGSADGSPGITASLAQNVSYPVLGPGGADDDRPLVLIDKITRLGAFRLQDDVPSGNGLVEKNPMLNHGSSPWSNAAKLTCAAGMAYGDLEFNRVIQFNPEGAARTDRFTPLAIKAVFVPVKGDSRHGVADTAAAACVWVTGITGQVSVFRP